MYSSKALERCSNLQQFQFFQEWRRRNKHFSTVIKWRLRTEPRSKPRLKSHLATADIILAHSKAYHVRAEFSTIQFGVSISRRWERVGSQIENCWGQEGAWGRAALCGVPCQHRSKVNLKRERAYLQALPGNLTFIVTQRGSFLSGIVLWQRVAPPITLPCPFGKSLIVSPEPSKRPSSYGTRGLRA